MASATGAAQNGNDSPGFQEMIVDTFKKFDLNSDGTISRNELKHVLGALRAPHVFTESDIDKLISAADTNRDGKIQYGEFVQWVLSDADPSAAASGAEPAPAPDRSESLLAAEGGGPAPLDYRTLLPERFNVDISRRYALDKLAVGEGGFGKVFVARDREFQNRLVAVKKVTRTRQLNRAQTVNVDMISLDKEISVMKELDHPNICKLLATFEQGRSLFFIMEYCEGGELFDKIIDEGFIDEANTANIIQQVSSALLYAHGRSIAHRDIKPENIVFCSKDPKDLRVKLIDWGLAIDWLDCTMNATVGSASYAAPEVMRPTTQNGQSSYTSACDLWSLGVVTYVMLSGKPPFWGTEEQHHRNALDERYPMTGEPWNSISNQAKNFVRSLMKASPTMRLPIDQCVAHPFLTTTDRPPPSTDTSRILANLKRFQNTTTFGRMCIAAVARQLDHRHLQDIHSVFREMDTNGNGVLEYDEVANGFKKMFGEDSDEYRNIRGVFEAIDLDGSQAIDYTEFCAAGLGEKTCTQDEVAWAAFKTFDLDNAGFISVANLQNILDRSDVLDAWSPDVCNQASREILGKYDKDKDGRINFEDWRDIMQRCWSHKDETAETAASSTALFSGRSAYELLVEVNKLPMHVK